MSKYIVYPVMEGENVVNHNTSNFEAEQHLTETCSVTPTSGDDRVTGLQEKVRVLIVDNSATVRTLFAKALAQSPHIEVVGTATDPFDAREKIFDLNPDVITLDNEMPRMNGITFLEKLMAHRPLPVIMVSSLGANGEDAQRALDIGAVEFVQKPTQHDPSLLSELGDILVQKILAASTARTKLPRTHARSFSHRDLPQGPASHQSVKLITIGGNVGCSEPLTALIQGLASDSPPVVVSASTISSFIGTFTQRLQSSCRVELQILRAEETPLSLGKVYFATADSHVTVQRNAQGMLVARLEKGGLFFGQRPSSEKLFQSAAESCGESVCGILLSSFSNDGISGLLRIRESGGVTIVQNPEECSFDATPTAAIEKGAADYILNVSEMPGCILQLRNKRGLQVGA